MEYFDTRVKSKFILVFHLIQWVYFEFQQLIQISNQSETSLQWAASLISSFNPHEQFLVVVH